MFKKLSNIGDCGVACDFGEEVNRSINTEVIKLFHHVKKQSSDGNLSGILNCLRTSPIGLIFEALAISISDLTLLIGIPIPKNGSYVYKSLTIFNFLLLQ